MIISVLLLLVGLGLVVYGSDLLVDGASSVAKKLGVSDFVIGIIIVGFGTSLPELVVSITGALEGSSAVALGNVFGSNIFNVMFILGLTTLLSPIGITAQNKKIDIPILLCISLFFCLIVLKGSINRVDAVIFILIFVAYSVFKVYNTFLSILMIIGGLAGLIIGGKLFVNNAVDIAHELGASEKFIAVTILAIGTSLPELMTCVVASAKKKSQLALGNIIGSNIFNILLILGIAGLIHPLETSSVTYVDMGVVTTSSLLLFLFANFSKKEQLSKPFGFTMLAMELAYMVYLFIKL